MTKYTLEFPKQRFKTILADPPWTLLTPGIRRPIHYPRMTTEEIKEMPVQNIVDPECCHLWLWTTNAHLPEAFEVMNAWGFHYKTMVTWIKPQLGLGWWIRTCTEHILLGVVGKGRKNPGNTRNYIVADRRGYSEKPEESYRLIETLSFEPRIELFSTKKREGWITMIDKYDVSSKFGDKGITSIPTQNPYIL